MHSTAPASSPVSKAAPPSFWHRRVVRPLVTIFTQGVTPGRLALTLAVGAQCSLFPFLGTTTALNFAVGLWLRLNQPVLQTLNQLLGPVQIALILVYVRIGETLWRAPAAERLSIAEMVRAFSELSVGEFLQRFGWAGIHALTAWTLTAPLILAAVYFPLHPLLQRLAARTGAPNRG